MTNETFARIRDYCRRHYVHDPFGYLGKLGLIPVVASDEVPDDEPELSEPPYAPGIRCSWADFTDLRRRCAKLEVEESAGGFAVPRCDFCGKPFDEANSAVPMGEGKRMHASCGLRSESGEMPPQDSGGHGLWGFSSGGGGLP